MKFYKRINDLINRALKGEDVTFLLGQMGIILDDIPKPDLSKKLREAYSKDIERKGILKRHGPEAALVILYIMHKLRDERDNRILSAKQLVDLTRERAKDTVVQRFLGWMSSIPAIETKTESKRDIAQFIYAPIKQLSTHEKLIVQDQTRKMQANMDAVVAEEGGALGYYWHSNFRVPGYNYRENHKHLDLDGKFIIYRRNWAEKQGLMKRGDQIYQDEIEQPGELPNCKCTAKFVYTLENVPRDCLTIKGLEYKKVS